MSWLARLQLDYRFDGTRTVSHDRHEGPLRVLRSLYPEGPAICHHVLVHPPGGIAGGDRLEVEARLGPGSHALITTPGATRFYRSDGPVAAQRGTVRVAAGARLEWLPLETIAYRGCHAENRLHLHLEPGAEAIGWDMLSLGLPAAGEAFDKGRYLQHVELDRQWLDRGWIDGEHDAALLRSPIGWAGRRVLGSLWMASGEPLDRPGRDALLESAREALSTSALAAAGGSTSPQPGVVVVRVLADRVEPVFMLLSAIRGRWRELRWALPAEPPRIWRT